MILYRPSERGRDIGSRNNNEDDDKSGLTPNTAIVESGLPANISAKTNWWLDVSAKLHATGYTDTLSAELQCLYLVIVF